MRKVLFWIHLVAGITAGIVIFIMSVTGVLLAFERQINARVDRGNLQVSGLPPLKLEELLAIAGGSPATMVVRSDPKEPVEISYGREHTLFVDPSTGQILGEGSIKLHAFFSSVENWHRWLASAGDSRKAGRSITGASNFLFLIIVLSGPFLWLPKQWTWKHVRPALWFRSATGKARDWNWHNTIGIWSFIPLVIIVASGVVMSYPWANNLVYILTRSEIPQQASGRGGGEKAHGKPDFSTLTARFEQATKQVGDWQSISIRLAPTGPFAFTIDRGNGAQPAERATLTLDRATGAVVRWEPYASLSTGRQVRSWLRFAHTGEVGGITGQIVAALSSLGAAVLVYTGFALAIRRLARWRRRALQQTASSAALQSR